MREDILESPIIPASRVGPLLLGMPAHEVLQIIGQPSRTRESVSTDGSRNAFWDFNALTVHLRDGVIAEIIPAGGFRGATPSGVTVGSTWQSLKAAHPRLVFDFGEFHCWMDPETPGVWFQVGRLDRSGKGFEEEEFEVTDPDHAFVLAIYVAAPITPIEAIEHLALENRAVATAFGLRRADDLTPGAYIAAGTLAQVLVEALLDGRMKDLEGVLDSLEEMLSIATGETRELLIVGLLEGIQNVSLNRGAALNDWIPLLGPMTKRAWDAVVEMWAGRMAPAAFNDFVASSPRGT